MHVANEWQFIMSSPKHTCAIIMLGDHTPLLSEGWINGDLDISKRVTDNIQPGIRSFL